MTYQIYGKGAKQLLIWEKATTIESKKGGMIKKEWISHTCPQLDDHHLPINSILDASEPEHPTEEGWDWQAQNCYQLCPELSHNE
jgi:hypothetical protein